MIGNRVEVLLDGIFFLLLLIWCACPAISKFLVLLDEVGSGTDLLIFWIGLLETFQLFIGRFLFACQHQDSRFAVTFVEQSMLSSIWCYKVGRRFPPANHRILYRRCPLHDSAPGGFGYFDEVLDDEGYGLVDRSTEFGDDLANFLADAVDPHEFR